MGLSMFEMITNKMASPSVPEFTEFYDALSRQVLPSSDEWIAVPKYLVELIYIFIVLLPERKLQVRDLSDHDHIQIMKANFG